MSNTLEGKPVSASRVVLTQVMLPEDANSAGNVHGGTIMKLADNAAYVVATRHCRSNVVTASVDRIDFLAPAYIGDLLTLKARLNWTGNTSMEIGIKIEAEDLYAGEIRHVATALLTFVALDDRGRPRPVPPLILETQEDKRIFKEAAQRAKIRKKTRQKIKN
ncbi:MAG: acyl-CoA thioesterase [Thermodesulfobacteria bacterium]|nr:acyl-CoA thioesterase [Thermodesulfobacteriota bacterium]